MPELRQQALDAAERQVDELGMEKHHLRQAARRSYGRVVDGSCAHYAVRRFEVIRRREARLWRVRSRRRRRRRASCRPCPVRNAGCSARPRARRRRPFRGPPSRSTLPSTERAVHVRLAVHLARVFGFRACDAAHQNSADARERFAQLMAMHDHVDHAVRQADIRHAGSHRAVVRGWSAE